MKKLFISLALLLGIMTAPTLAADTKSAKVTIKRSTSAYAGKKDKAYWTRVWYQKQAAKGRYYKNKKRRVKRKARSKKRSYSGRGGRVLAKIDLSSQRMSVYQGGRLMHTWKVSTGRKGYGTPTGTWRIHRMHRRYFSKKYDNAPMPHAMFYHRGFAVHGTGSIKRLGRPASHGCVRLHPSNAATLFSMVRRNGGTVKVVY